MKRSYVIAALIAVGAVGWVASGQIPELSGAPSPSPAAPEAAALGEREPVVPTVRVERRTAEPMVNEIILQGRTEESRSVELKSEASGRVEEVLAERGARVSAGDVIVRVATNERAAELAQAQALLAQREIELNGARQLSSKGFQSEMRLAEAQALYDAAEAAVLRAELALAKTEIKAPFEGVLDRRPTELGDFLDVGEPVATIVDLDPIKVIGELAERHIATVHPGAVGHARLLDGTEVEGEIAYVSAVGSNSTRTFTVELRVPNPDGRIKAGQTAQLRVPVDTQMAHRLAPSALTLDDEGTIGVKIVTADSRVRFVPVEILGDTSGGVWLAGLPEEAVVITVGQEYVVPDQLVRPVEGVVPASQAPGRTPAAPGADDPARSPDALAEAGPKVPS